VPDLPVVFVGSSSESLNVARAVQNTLRKIARTSLWTDIFRPGGYTFDELRRQVRQCDFAVLILASDDSLSSRGTRRRVPRDNVIFEAGMLMAVLGPRRSLLLEDSSVVLKVPKDIDGITTVRFDGGEFASKGPRGILRALSKVREEVQSAGLRSRTDIAAAVDSLFVEDENLAQPVSTLVTRSWPSIASSLANLYSSGDYLRHAHTALCVRGIFEINGNYKEGVAFNEKLVHSLNELGRVEDALWTELKGVGYLRILSSDYKGGRQGLEKLYRLTEKSKIENALLRAYICRYIGISFHRDPQFADLNRAQEYFERSATEVESIQRSSPEVERRFSAKLLRNRGNLELARSNFEGAAQLFRKSRLEFIALEDSEHAGISALALSKALRLCNSHNVAEMEMLLQDAELSAMALGWKEGFANALEERAHYLLYLADESTGKRGIKFRREALFTAKRAEAAFQATDARHRTLSIAGFIEQLRSKVVDH